MKDTQPAGLLKKIIWWTALILLAWILPEAAIQIGGLYTFDHLYFDLFHTLSGRRAEPKHVAIATIDNETLLQYRDVPLVFWGPHFARGMEVLRNAGVRVIGLDYLFTVSIESWLRKMGTVNDASRTYEIPMRRELATGKVVLIGWLASHETKGETELLLPPEDYLFALPNGRGDVGLANFFSDEDGVIRHFLPSLFSDETIPHLTFATLLALKACHLEPTGKRWLGGEKEILRQVTPERIDFIGPPGTFPRVSFLRLLNPEAEKDPEIQNLRGKVVIIAPDHVGMQDVHLTPYARGFWKWEGKMMSGAELHANIVETLLSGRSLKPVPVGWKTVYSIGLITIGTILFFRLHPVKGLIAGLLLSGCSILFAYGLFTLRWILPVFGLQMGLAFSYLGTLGWRLTGEEKERKALRQMFGRYVSDAVVEKLMATGHRPDLGGEVLRVTVLFADIRNFTTLSERLTPHQVVQLLNLFLGKACEVIQDHGGTVDKFIGDALMAVFGSPIPSSDHARRALNAALALQEVVNEIRLSREGLFSSARLPPFEVGLGIHTGEAVVGNIGSPRRMEFTAIGDVVNTASRLEGLTKTLGWAIAASLRTIQSAGPGVLTGRREKVSLKGKEEEIEVVEVIGLAPERGGNL